MPDVNYVVNGHRTLSLVITFYVFKYFVNISSLLFKVSISFILHMVIVISCIFCHFGRIKHLKK